MMRGGGACVCVTSDERTLRAAIAASGMADSARITRPNAATMRCLRLVRATSANQLPVRIARTRVAGECPDIGDIRDLVRVAVDNGAGLVAGDRDHLRDKANGELCVTVARFGSDELGLVDRHETRFGLALLALPILDRGVEAVIDLGRQQVFQRALVAIGFCLVVL